MTLLNILETKTNLTKLIRELETKQEDEFIICRNGKPCAKLILYENNNEKRVLGKCDGEFYSPSWDEWKKMDSEIEEDFEKAVEDFSL